MPRRPSLLALSCLLAATLALPAPAWAAKKTGKATATTKQVRTKHTATRSSSDESRQERERRLQRECQGRPNAGACLGYAN
ncbi:MAG TPA: hypothetical protein VGC24_00390 [Burkholderiaceae bacterium]